MLNLASPTVITMPIASPAPWIIKVRFFCRCGRTGPRLAECASCSLCSGIVFTIPVCNIILQVIILFQKFEVFLWIEFRMFRTHGRRLLRIGKAQKSTWIGTRTHVFHMLLVVYAFRFRDAMRRLRCRRKI